MSAQPREIVELIEHLLRIQPAVPGQTTERTPRQAVPTQECRVNQCGSGRPRAGASTRQARGSWASKSGQVCIPTGA